MASIHEGHRARVKSRFLAEGLDTFEPHQVLELLLFYAVPYRDTNQLAHELLTKYGSLAAVFEADYHDLQTVTGLGPNGAMLLKMIPQLCRVYDKDKWKERPKLGNTPAAADYVLSLFRGRVEEAFYVLCLDSKNRLLRAELLQEGGLTEVNLNPRTLVETVLRYKAVGVILAHNHPAGDPTPSRADLESTRIIAQALKPIGVPVHDHIIVGGEDYVSFARNKLINTGSGSAPSQPAPK